MLGIDPRAARATWTVFLFALTIWVVYLVRETILIFVAAIFAAYVLSPVVDFVHERFNGRLSRTASLALTYVLLLVVVGITTANLGARAIREGTELAQQLPELVKKHEDLSTVPLPSWLEPYKERMLAFVRSQLDTSAERLLPIVQRAVGGVIGVIGSLGFVILVPILTFFFMKDAELFRGALIAWVPARHRPLAEDILEDVHVLLGQYIRALVILAVVTSIVYLVFFEIIRLPYAVLLSALAAPLEFIPFIGPLLGTILILLVALFTGYPHIWWILIFFGAYRLFQDYVLQPYLMSQGVEMHPAVVIFGALAGQQLGGLWGMFLSVPVLATLRIILVRARKRRHERDLVETTQS